MRDRIAYCFFLLAAMACLALTGCGGLGQMGTSPTPTPNPDAPPSSAPNEWTWVGGSGVGGQSGTYGTLGIPAAGNVPGGRINAATWIDARGNLWLFGGFSIDSAGEGYLNDLWEYQP